ncbi:DUF1992 domain-containing protein [Nocardia flavorosea]|uniref:DnaJ family domain-containing protein n=1 Tax=Nocardia flavorosea TaxID=53429 RepID=UPI001893C9EE|nr:DUF1992 domain-containing protein [Nocardia flavorosea]MBF6352409.1 DUF1992 domain-containing protein [Nocardia flavorosea]
MSERKPAGVDFESWVDRKIREATERGEFENLPGSGKPLPGAGSRYHDENAWLRDYLRREGLRGDVALPPSLQLRREVERLPETVRELTTEEQVRATVAALNRRIVDWLRVPTGPQVPVAPVDAEQVVAGWRAATATAGGASAAPPPVQEPERGRGNGPGSRRPWWRRIGRNSRDS